MINKTFIIAEAGVNHNGDKDLAFQLVDAAVEAGADAVKFQTFKAENLVTRNALKAEYQQRTTNAEESQFEMLKKLELPYETHHELMQYCIKRGIKFLSTAFDSGSLDFLVSEIGLKTLKIPSGEITNGPLLLEHARTGFDLILSTGMSTLDEIEEALGVIAFGLTGGKEPSSKEFKEAYASKNGQKELQDKVTLLHCTTEYPAPLEDINLLAMKTMRDAFGLEVGYSDHSEGITVPITAVALGATVIEKHFTLDKKMQGSDHKASLEPDELKEMVRAIREVERVIGDGIKQPTDSELKNKDVARKSLVASEDIRKGENFTESNLTSKRPGTGKSPMEYWDVLGSVSEQNYQADGLIEK